jgi:influenza virus NS1A-binding protein
MSEGKRALNAVALPDGIYVLGGYNGREYLNTMERYEIFSGKWSEVRPMNTSRGTFSAIVSQNCNYIYAIGGFNAQPLDHVERYDSMLNTWEYLAPMKQRRFMHAACLANM